MEKKDFKILRIFNDEELLKLKNKEIASLKKNLNKVPKNYKKKLIKISNRNPQINKKIGFISYYQRKKRELLTQKRNTQEEIKQLIEKIKTMDLEGYLRYLKKRMKKRKMKKRKMKKKLKMQAFKIF